MNGSAPRLLEVVPWVDRLRAGRLRPPVGLIRNDVRSLPELAHLLAPNPKSLPGVDLAAAATWVETVIGDGELACLVREEAAREGSYVERCLRVHAVVARRVEEARRDAGETEPPPEEEV